MTGTFPADGREPGGHAPDIAMTNPSTVVALPATGRHQVTLPGALATAAGIRPIVPNYGRAPDGTSWFRARFSSRSPAATA